MSPISMNTLDSQTLQLLAQNDQRPLPCGEKAERWFGQAAMAVIGVALVSVLVL